MPKAGRVLAAGTKLYAGPAGALLEMGGVVSIGGPNLATESVDVTELDPYEGTSTLPVNPEFFKDFVAGWRDAGSVELTINFTRTAYSTYWLVWYRRGTDLVFNVKLRNGDIIAVAGHITALGQAYEMNNLVQNTVTLKCTGAPSFTPGP